MSKILIEKYAFDVTVSPPLYCVQKFIKVDGGMEHWMDNQLRSTIPDASIVQYLISPNIKQCFTDKEIDALLFAYADVEDSLAAHNHGYDSHETD